jgi:single-strand DNA-binding protein
MFIKRLHHNYKSKRSALNYLSIILYLRKNNIMAFSANGNSLEADGILIEVYDIQQVSPTFKKREFAVEFKDDQYPNFATFQLVQDKCSLIDGYEKGEKIKVSFNIKGNKYEKNGVTRYITNLTAWRIAKAGAAGPNDKAPSVEEPSINNTTFTDDAFDSGLPF